MRSSGPFEAGPVEPSLFAGLKKLTAFLLLLIALLQYRLWLGDGSILELHRLGERIEELKREGDKRRERNAAFEAEVMDLKQGSDAIEERARHELGMIKEGEVFIQVLDHHHPAGERQPAAPTGNIEEAQKEGVARKRPRQRPMRDHHIAPVADQISPGRR